MLSLRIAFERNSESRRPQVGVCNFGITVASIIGAKIERPGARGPGTGAQESELDWTRGSMRRWTRVAMGPWARHPMGVLSQSSR